MPRDRQDTSSERTVFEVQMSEKEFARFSDFIYQEAGIHLTPAKKTMIEVRLRKRLRWLNISTFKSYLDFLYSPTGQERELVHLIDVVTTNTTDFFREPKHFQYLDSNLLPRWMEKAAPGQSLRVWSAGCSIGMEPYTLAIVFEEFRARNQDFAYKLLATDISTQALEQAVRGIYDLERIEPVSLEHRRKYFLRSRDATRQLVRVAPILRQRVLFRRLNFMEAFHFTRPLDIIFCRNVIIYFDRPTQEKLFIKFCRQLRKGGHIFVGHSESLNGMDLPLRAVAPTIYERT